MKEYYFSKCLDEKENISKEFSHKNECRTFVMNKVINDKNNSNPRLPIGSLVLLVISLIIILKEMILGKSIKIRKK